MKRLPLPVVLSRLHHWTAKHHSQRAAALAAKISPQYLSDMLLDRKPISDSVLKLIGVRRVVIYEEIEKDAVKC